MIALLLSPFYILVHIYIAVRLLGWLKACHRVFAGRFARAAVTGAFVFVSGSVLTSFLLPPSPFQRLLKQLGGYWLGILLYMILTLSAAELIRLALRRLRFRHKELLFSRKGFAAAGGLSAAVILALTAAGIAGASDLRETQYSIEVDKSGGELEGVRVVLAADLHLGYSAGLRRMERMVSAINAWEPDLVVFAGDIFDNEYEALEDPEELAAVFRGIRSRFGVYACYGNHDIRERLLAGFTVGGGREKVSDPRMDAFLEDAGITLLRDEGVMIADSFYLYGRPDARKPGRGIEVRKTPEEITAGMDPEKPVLVLDHQPRELAELARAGVDVDLCGHTHDGQLFPGNLLAGLMWENPCGYLKMGDMHNIVTSGVGVFGPSMRLGTRSEICEIEILFTGESRP